MKKRVLSQQFSRPAPDYIEQEVVEGACPWCGEHYELSATHCGKCGKELHKKSTFNFMSPPNLPEFLVSSKKLAQITQELEEAYPDDDEDSDEFEDFEETPAGKSIEIVLSGENLWVLENMGGDWYNRIENGDSLNISERDIEKLEDNVLSFIEEMEEIEIELPLESLEALKVGELTEAAYAFASKLSSILHGKEFKEKETFYNFLHGPETKVDKGIVEEEEEIDLEPFEEEELA